MIAADRLFLIPLLPLAAAAIGTCVRRENRQVASGAAIVAMAASFVLSAMALATALQNPAAHQVSNFTWFTTGTTAIELGWLLDPLAGFMCTMVTFVGTLIFIFSTGYMKDDPNYGRFFCFLSLFAAGMLGLLVANSLLLLFICWEIVGLASYLLIGFWFHKPEAAAAAKKAFITTRIGDLGLLLGLLWLYRDTGTLLFYNDGAGVLEATALFQLNGQMVIGGLAASTAIGLLIFCGAVGKSGQFPLHVWLPDAMEGPTPVSALIHAATMVAAGVFLIARVDPLMSVDQLIPDALPPPNVIADALFPATGSHTVHALTVVAWIGAITALFGAVIAVAQYDIKRILAFSTVSQLGYMMLALGVGSWTAAIFHLLTHAFFKALLFLGAGSVIHAAHHEQDIRRLGGLGGRMRTTFATFAIGMMALSGVPFLFSGFWSKEAVLHAAHEWDVSHLPFYIGLVAVVLTAFYMTRLMAEVFRGAPRTEAAAHAHENSPVMTIPLVLLAIGSIALGFIGTPAWPWLQSALTGQAVEAHSLLDGAGLTLLSIVLVALGIGTGWALYGRRLRPSPTAADPLDRRAPRLFAALQARLGFDELYAATAGRTFFGLGWLADALDRRVWGGLISFLGKFAQFSGGVNREADEGGLNAGFDRTSRALRGLGRIYSNAQTGDVHGYLRILALGFSVLALFLAVFEGAGL